MIKLLEQMKGVVRHNENDVRNAIGFQCQSHGVDYLSLTYQEIAVIAFTPFGEPGRIQTYDCQRQVIDFQLRYVGKPIDSPLSILVCEV